MAICMDEIVFYIGVISSVIVVIFLLNKKEQFSEINLSKDELIDEIKKLKDLIYQTTIDPALCRPEQSRDPALCRPEQSRERCERNLAESQSQESQSKQYTDSAPKRIYTTDTTNFYQIGYLIRQGGGGVIYPLYGRRMYRQRSDRWEYYTIENSENKVRIPIKTKNDQELNDTDTVELLGEVFTVKLYEYTNFRYIG
jgi:hypothetical protein